MTLNVGSYNAQCMNGHVFGVRKDSELERQCEKSAENGKLDALIISTDDCPSCIELRRESQRRMDDAISLNGCPMQPSLDEDCDADCPCRSTQDIPNSRYDRELIYTAFQP